MQNRGLRFGRGGLCAGLVVAAGLTIGVASPASAQVEWRSGTAAALAPMSRVELVESMQAMQAAGEARQHRLVTVHTIPTKAERAQLAREGVHLQRFVGDNAYFAAIETDKVNLSAPLTNAMVARVDVIRKQWKMHEDLAAGVLQPWMIVRQDLVEPKPGDDISDEEVAKQIAVQTIVAVYVQFHTDVDLLKDAVGLAKKHGAFVRSRLESVNALVIELPSAHIDRLADEDAVSYIEPPLPKFEELNAENRAITGADVVNAAPYNLDGAGVTVMVYDGGEGLASHSDFSGRMVVGDSSGLSDHATHVAGTIGGDGTQNPMHRGMAPAVDLVSYGFEQEGGLQEGFLYTDPGDLEADYTEAITVHGADISNNSIGTNTAPNGFPCEWEGNYGLTGATIDAIAKGSLGSPFRIVWANGNERQGFQACGGTYLTTAPPACAKNHITVGALNANDDSVTDFTSWGPCDDGRIKPDISGPGCQSDGDGGVTSLSSSGGYTQKCGTSMSSPTVCGLGALILQDFRANYPGEPDPRNSTLKALFANTAADIVTPGPDYQSGYGSVRIQPAIDTLRAGNFAENEVDQGGSTGLVVVVDAGTPELKITIAWDDEPGTPNVNPVLVNDLDLVVTSPSGQRYYPWTLDPANPADPAVQTVEDHVNNIEQVQVSNPEAGGWSVEVVGFAVPSGPQPFSIASSSFLVNCSSAGIATINGNNFACEDDLSMKVVDCDLNTSDMVVDTVDVLLTSTTDPVGMMITLTETAAESAAFLATQTISASGASGALAVADGDTITMTYIDADDGDGMMNVVRTDTAMVDCVAPMISNVMAIDVDARNATITFDTNEEATPVVHYGTMCGSFTEMVTGAALNTSHAVTLTGLDDNTPYFFAIDVVDEAGNMAADDNGGSCYTFVTPEVPDFLTEGFGGDFDLDGQKITFTPNGSIDFYDVCVEPIIALPSDPTGGTTLSLGDDSPSAEITPSGMLSLYGTSYGSAWVNPNGNITFGTADSDYTETFDEHFDTPRISALWDDLTPTQSGTVSWRDHGDRVSVTYDGVTEYNAGNSNTFQVEMFFDGTITLSYLGIDSSDSIVGVSEGSGLSPDFFESDLSSYGACGPRPPAAAGGSYSTAAATGVNMELMASDDGLPMPSMVSLWVDSLPTNGSLIDLGSGSVISSVPHQVNGSMVRYAPLGLYQGTDSFTFYGDDGGSAPDGGPGSSATINLTVGGPQSVHEFLTDDSDPMWSGDGQWAFGMPQGIDGDPSSGFTGDNVLGYNLSGDYTNNMPQHHLVSNAINMSGVTGSEVSFQRWLGVESSTFDHASFDVSNDGSAWTNLYDHSGATMNETSWTEVTYDISSIADGQPTVYLRWTMGTTDGSVTYQGWNIDDIVLRGLQPLADCDGDVDLDGDVDFDDLNAILFSWDSMGTTRREGDLDSDGDTDFDDLNEVLMFWGMACK